MLGALDEAMALPQRFVTPTARHVRLAFALRDRIQVVDDLYLALADELDYRQPAALTLRMECLRYVDHD